MAEETGTLTAEQKLEVNTYVSSILKEWLKFLGVANFSVLIGAIIYMFFILPGKVISETTAEANRVIAQITANLNTQVDNNLVNSGRASGKLEKLEKDLSDMQIRIKTIRSYITEIQEGKVKEVAALLKASGDNPTLPNIITRIDQMETGRKIHTGYIAPEGWSSRVVLGKTRGWEKYWEGTIIVPPDAVGKSGNALIAITLMGHGLGEDCYFSVFLDDEPFGGDELGASLIQTNKAIPNTWMNAAYANFEIISDGEHRLSVVVNNSPESKGLTCALNGARLNYAIIPAEVIQDDPIIVQQIK